MWTKIAGLMLSTLLLAGCGGGCAEAAAEGTACLRPCIQLFGDSTMAGAVSHWQEAFGLRIEGRAAGGATTTKLIAGEDRMNLPWPQSVDARYYVINHGMNDGNKKPGKGGISVEQYKANLRILAKAPHATPIFQTPNPAFSVYREDIWRYANAMRQVAAEYGIQVIDVHACFQRQPNWRERLPDGTHPDEQGYRYIVEHCVTPVVEKLPCAG
jgi:lysophospholipase L1-like esterase